MPNSTDSPEIRERLREFSARRGMNQTQFAALLSMERPSLNRVLTGAQRISPEFIGRFFLAFGSEATCEVFDDDGVASPHCTPVCQEAV